MSYECRIYVASLADYNAGTHHGEWIDFDDCADAGEVRDRINAILASSPYALKYGLPAEEWAMHDYEGFPDGLGESPSIERLYALYEAVEEHGEAYVEYAEHVGSQYATVEGFESAYQGQYRNMEEYAEQLVEDCGYLHGMPETLQYYFDYERFARDLEINGDYYITDGGHVFSNH